MLELSRQQQPEQIPLRQGEFARQTLTHLATLPGSLADELTDMAGRVFDRSLATGAWHGDWRQSNCAVHRGRVLAWDWERFAHGAPVGADAIHYEFSARLRRLDPHPAARSCAHDAHQILTTMGIAETDALRVALATLLAVGARYAADGQPATSHTVGRLSEWLLPVLREFVEEL